MRGMGILTDVPGFNLCFSFDLLSDRSDLNYPPVIGSLNALGLAADFLAPGDRIHQIDGISTVGLTNEHVLNVLCNGSGAAVAILEIEYSLPEYRTFDLRQSIF